MSATATAAPTATTAALDAIARAEAAAEKMAAAAAEMAATAAEPRGGRGMDFRGLLGALSSACALWAFASARAAPAWRGARAAGRAASAWAAAAWRAVAARRDAYLRGWRDEGVAY